MVQTRSAAKAAEAEAEANPTSPIQAPRASTASITGPPFRFLDLPPELRNRIYAFTLACPSDSAPYNLADFKDPAITGVSRQVRSESLPVFFAEGTFEVLVASNLCARSDDRAGWRASRQTPAKAGTLGIRRSAMTFMRQLRETVVFRHVKMYICDLSDAHMVRHSKYADEQKSGFLTAGVLDLLFTGNSLDTTCQNKQAGYTTRPRRWRGRGHGYWDLEDVDEAFKAAAAAAAKVSERDDFMGLTIKDLDHIAKAFRFQPSSVQ